MSNMTEKNAPPRAARSAARHRTTDLPSTDITSRVSPELPRGGVFTVPVQADAPPEHLFRQLVAAYLNGADEFVIVAPDGLDDATRRLAHTFADRTAASETLAEDDQVLVLRDASDGPDVALPMLLNRMQRAVRTMQETAGGFLEATHGVDPSGLAEADDDVDRLAWLVERTLALRLAQGQGDDGPWVPDPISPLLLARALERIADHAVVLGEHAAHLSECDLPIAVRTALQAYHRQALEYLDEAFAVSASPDVQRANDLLDTAEALHAAHRTLTESFLVRNGSAGLSPLASAGLGLVLQSIDRTVAYAEDIVEVGLDRAVGAQLLLGRVSPGLLPAAPDDERPPHASA
jgi:hypothetical protein